MEPFCILFEDKCVTFLLTPLHNTQAAAAHLVDDGQIPGVGEEPGHAGHAWAGNGITVLFCTVLYCTVLYTPNERVMALRLLITLSVSGHQRIWGPAHGRETVMMINMNDEELKDTLNFTFDLITFNPSDTCIPEHIIKICLSTRN